MLQKNNLAIAYIIFIIFLIDSTCMAASWRLSDSDVLSSDTLKQSSHKDNGEIQKGIILKSVKCLRQTDQSYALFLPTAYMPDRTWPIIYAFDPAARGNIPVELMKEAAEKYGYIIAASNNSRNGPWEPEAKAAQSMWEDTHTKFSINDNCVYFAGFSGGARVSSYLAQACKCAQGILLNGAGYNAVSPPASSDNFAVFETVGFTDMNYDEMIRLNKTLDTLNVFHFLRRFSGSHQWAPKEVWNEALAWLRLIAMKNGRLARDVVFINAELDSAMQRAKGLENSGEPFFALQNYFQLFNTFQGLTDTKKIAENISALEKSDAAIKGQDREEKELDEQARIQTSIIRILGLMHQPKPAWISGEQLENYPIGDQTFGKLKSQAEKIIVKLRDDLTANDKLEKNKYLKRARDVVYNTIMDIAKSDFESNNLLVARNLFDLAIQAKPDLSPPYILLARCLIRLGEKEDAINILGKVRDKGLSASELADLAKMTAEFNSLTEYPEYQKLIKNEPADIK